MAGSINKVILVGNLGADPKVSNTANGAKIVNLNIATSDSWRDKASGERKERTEWHRVVIFNPSLADVAEKYLHKGSKVYLEGQLQTRRWEDNNGQKRYATEVIAEEIDFADTPKKTDESVLYSSTPVKSTNQNNQEEEFISDGDDLPF